MRSRVATQQRLREQRHWANSFCRPKRPMNDQRNDHGIHFRCLRGANARFALAEPNSFALQDALSRDWICFPVPQVVQELDMLPDLVEVVKADEKAGEKNGRAAGGLLKDRRVGGRGCEGE